ncbi:hypothetical protein [Marinobacter shengliensis]|uniref:hypothetical protein n=1 Tax=Marinobacter shengliensis TaxID=1389223 RepID=UPI0011099D40|nr:hypothetical protein [Marinobacter shengliensis]
MSITIVLPSGSSPRTGAGTKIYTEDGHEIKGVTKCTVHITPNGCIAARLDVCVKEVENLEGIEGHVTITNPEDEAVNLFCADVLKGPSK